VFIKGSPDFCVGHACLDLKQKPILICCDDRYGILAWLKICRNVSVFNTVANGEA
jgi:hypothetical protein